MATPKNKVKSFITLEDLKGGVKTATVDYEGTKFDITFRADGYTCEFEDLVFSEYTEGSKVLDNQVKALAGLMVSWDICDAEGNPIQPTLEVLRTINMGLVSAMWDAIREVQNPNAETSNN